MRPLAATVIALLVLACRNAEGTASSEAIEATRAPVQTPVEPGTTAIQLEAGEIAFSLTPVASYRIAARVLHTERYYFGWTSRLAPVDLALGWGYMSDPAVDRFISWSQSRRWYFYRTSANSPFQTDAISAESANVHIVPGSTNLRRALLALSAGDTVLLTGHLIIARLAKESAELEWRSSLSRSDRGDGSCELMLVDRLVHAGVEYR